MEFLKISALNDCSQQEGICDRHAFCIGSFKKCICQAGYVGDGLSCYGNCFIIFEKHITDIPRSLGFDSYKRRSENRTMYKLSERVTLLLLLIVLYKWINRFFSKKLGRILQFDAYWWNLS